MLAIGLVAPVADGFGGGGGQEWVSAQGADGQDGTVFGDLNFEDDVARATAGEGCGGILGIGAAQETGLGVRGRQPDALGWVDLSCCGLRCGELGCGDPTRRRCFHDGIAVLPGGIGLRLALRGSGLHAKDDFTFFVDD